MQIVFTKKVAEDLREKYTVLELEEVPVDGKMLEAFCVVSADKIIGELEFLTDSIQEHNRLVQAIKDNDTTTCLELCEHLTGKFGGELDTFYSVITNRIKKTNSTAFTTAITE